VAATPGGDSRIVDLLQVEEPARGVDWLKASLQTAVELELATLPVYLIGLWSIIDQRGEVFDLVESVIKEEMLHLGLACNMLKAIGGSPQMNVMKYPGRLPGGVRREEVFLAGLSLDSLAMYMDIEKPEDPLTREPDALPTIGEFYDKILAAFVDLPPSELPEGHLQAEGQLEATLHVPLPTPPPPGGSPTFEEHLRKLTTLDEVRGAIGTIKDQGEGTSTSPHTPRPKFHDELAHFYRFGEIHAGKRLIPVDGQFDFKGDPIPLPPCLNVPRVPPDGYPESRDFDHVWTELLDTLQLAWRDGSQDKLSDAMFGGMFRLRNEGRRLVQKERLPDHPGTFFGPDFKRVP
jgi:Ferritin-like